MSNCWGTKITFNTSENKNTIKNKKNENSYTTDHRLKKLWIKLRQNEYESRNNKFKEWCNTYLSDDIDMTYGDVLTMLYNKTTTSLNKDGYYIKNKEFKDELATLVYRESDVNA